MINTLSQVRSFFSSVHEHFIFLKLQRIARKTFSPNFAKNYRNYYERFVLCGNMSFSCKFLELFPLECTLSGLIDEFSACCLAIQQMPHMDPNDT